TQKRPSRTAIVAGEAPISRTAASTERAVSTLEGYGMPWVMIVDSSATTGFLVVRASAISGEKSRRSATLIAQRFSSGQPWNAPGQNYRPKLIGNVRS